MCRWRRADGRTEVCRWWGSIQLKFHRLNQAQTAAKTEEEGTTSEPWLLGPWPPTANAQDATRPAGTLARGAFALPNTASPITNSTIA